MGHWPDDFLMGHWPDDFLMVMMVITLIVIGSFAATLLIGTDFHVQAVVVSSNQYPAGTIDGTNQTIVGYNITVSYRGLTRTLTVLCPLYPVGSHISATYGSGAWFWLGPFLTINSLPAGCNPTS